MALKLKKRQRLFINLFVWSDPPITQAEAARRAGYEDADASHAGYQLLRRPHVRAAYEKQLAEREELVKLRSLRWVAELERIALMDPSTLFDANGELLSISAMTEDARRTIAAIDIEALYEGAGRDRIQTGEVRKFRLHDKKGALELLLKWAGKLKDKVEIEGGLTLDQLVPGRKKPPSGEGSD